MRSVALVLALSACAPTWTGATHVATLTDDALIGCDVGQTIWESDGGRWDRPGVAQGSVLREMDPALGPTPPISLLTVVGVLAIYGTTLTGYSRLPSWAKFIVLGGIGAVEGTLVVEHAGVAGACGVR